MTVAEKFKLDGFYLVYVDILSKPQLVKAKTRKLAEDLVDQYWHYDLDYMAGGREEHITGSKEATIEDIAAYISDGYYYDSDEDDC